ncbi:DNA replication ATP-dependent helicase/nuclease DNA2 [Eurytemora carolleeae]|uniref:DNA replication ATP-dependent helicase/nuclease DNA2 n=1 Tax=Eurytemora carolleeae TaxID=1294199 RepID=UPI000C78F32F|nr:DNA replication ATP-dependent helicase/nuclease DNA2 [Eurytemora carolleeae]|eukprot:XP_023336216.1 DNA replication ATP-dependent helicase/nuclease DNA2-like [Eurytemora affinis]
MMTENYCLIRGMPGSGKSTTIVGLIRLLAKLGQSILLVAYTNSAVDTVLCKLKKFETKFLRLGRSARVRDELQEFTADRVCCNITSCDELSQLYKSYNIIATTCLATNHAAIINRTFDWCIIDEASQALLPSVIHPILFSKKFILVGDPAQLPPVVQNHHARKLGLAQSLFERLDCPAATIDLNIQYRMNQTIADLANHLTYKGKLECADESVAQRNLKLNLESGVKPWLSAALSQKQEESVVFLDTHMEAREEPLPGGVRNIMEGHIVLQLVGEARRGGLDETEIAVIAPYAAQVKHLQVVMKKAGFCVEVGTVDQFQGRDSELVIYSCTRSFINSGEKEKISAGHILNDERRLNVAITRARSKLVIVGCLQTLVREYKPFRNMLSFLENGKTVQLCQDDMKIPV